MPAPLEGLRVIDLSIGPAGGLATTVLVDFGAEGIKVERPGGDPFRSLAAAPMWLRGKRSVVCDLKSREGRRALQRLTEGADIVVTTFAPGRARELGADPETLCKRNPALIYCAISAWGPRGPYAHYPGWEGLVAAKSGRMRAFEGQKPRPGPSFAAVPVATHAAAQGAVQGILAALLARERDGRGRVVETSLLRALLPYDLMGLPLVQLIAREPERFSGLPEIGGGMPTLNYHPVRARDGRWIQLGNLLEHLFYAFLECTGLLSELLQDESYQGPPERWSRDALEHARDRILGRMQERDADDWMRVFRANGNVAAEIFGSARQALEHPDLLANRDVATHVHPDLGPVRQPGVIAHLRETPGRAGGPAPRVGEHSASVLAELPRSRAVGSAGARAGPPPGRPLEGVCVLEISTIIAAPLAASMLGDLGARVIKIEPIGGDPFRAMGIGPTVGLMASKTNASKESICVDLKSDEGAAIARDLIQRADILIHNFRPGVPERLGIGWEQASALQPGLVWVAVNGYGPEAPGARRPSAHPCPGAAMGGALRQAGAGLLPTPDAALEEVREVARQLMRANEANPDPNTSAVVASSALLGLCARQRHGVGQPIFVNMLEANAWANADECVEYAGRPAAAQVDPDLLGLDACYRLYPTRKGWVFLAIVTDREWRAFCEAVGRDAWAQDPRFDARDSRCAHREVLSEELARLFESRDAESWEERLVARGVGCVRADGAHSGEFFAFDPHALANDLAPPARHARFGDLRRFGPLVVCDGGAEAYGPGVLAGEHTDSILAEIGRSAAQIAWLRSKGVVASEPLTTPSGR
ncbi:MAG: CaiB/BaiF CoA transferase family protein [Myxococcota bacterium]